MGLNRNLGNITEAVTIYGTNVGIGTLTDNGYKLDVNGTARVSNAMTANSFVKAGGTSSQVLAADGSVVTAGSGITISGGSISSTVTGGVTSFNTRTGAITLSSTDVTTALGYTPYNSTNPNGYISSYTETDTLSSVTGRGSSTSTQLTFSGGGDNSNTYSSVRFAGYNQGGGNGYYGFFELENTYSSGTNKKKFFRLDSTGTIQIINSAYTSNIFNLTDAGDLTVSKIIKLGGTSSQYLMADGSVSVGGGGGVTSFNTRTGSVTLTSGDVTGALGYTPYNSSNPNGYISSYTETDTLATVTSRGSTTSASITAERYKGNNSLVLSSYATVNPSSNVFLYSQPNDRDSWLYLDSADTGSNWGIYHRQIDSAVSGLEGNAIGFIGGGNSSLKAFIGLSTGNGYFANNLTVGGNSTVSGSSTITGSLTVSSNNANGGGIILADDGDIVDLNDSYCSMRFSGGVRIFSANRGGSPVITLSNGGVVSASSFSGSGSGLSGTASSLNIGGSAGSVPWGGVSSKPSYLMYYQGFTLDANTMDTNATGFTYSVNAPWTGPIVKFSTGGGYDLQINSNYGNGQGISYRTRNGDAGSFNPWYRLYSDSYRPYADYSGYSNSVELTGGNYIWFNGSGYHNVRMYESYGIVMNMISHPWHMQLLNGSALIGFSASGGNYGIGNGYFTGDVTAYYSDRRLKHNLNLIDNAIEKVKSLNGYTYQHNELGQELLKENAFKVHAGLVAQEVQAVLPEVVTIAPFDLDGYDEQGKGISKSGENYLTIKYERIVPLLIEAIKEQQTQIEELKELVNKLINK